MAGVRGRPTPWRDNLQRYLEVCARDGVTAQDLRELGLAVEDLELIPLAEAAGRAGFATGFQLAMSIGKLVILDDGRGGAVVSRTQLDHLTGEDARRQARAAIDPRRRPREHRLGR